MNLMCESLVVALQFEAHHANSLDVVVDARLHRSRSSLSRTNEQSLR